MQCLCSRGDVVEKERKKVRKKWIRIKIYVFEL
jgi:hypothetical protein